MQHRASTWWAVAATALLPACGAKSPLEILEASAGSGASTTGTTGSGASTTGTTGSGTAGSGGGALGCSTPNPAGCLQTGCAAGLTCDLSSPVCKPSSCVCDPATGAWACDDDCSGGECVESPVMATHFARFGYVQGQEGTGDFCVAYEFDADGQPIFHPAGLLAGTGLSPDEFEGMDRLSRYFPLEGPPVALGKAYTSCGGFVKSAFVPPGATHYTLISVPFSGEPDHLWVIEDPGFLPEKPGLRIVNAIRESVPILATVDGHALGQIEWANSPAAFEDISTQTGFNHLAQLVIQNESYGIQSMLSWAGWDLIPMQSLTIYVSGLNPAFTGLGCFDAKPDTGGKLSNCWLVHSR